MSKKKKKCTIKDVAKAAEVGISTVSRAMNTPDLVSDRVLKKVLKVVAEFGYTPSNIAQSFRRGDSDVKNKTRNIALVSTNINGFRTHCCGKNILTGVEYSVREANYNLIILSWPLHTPLPRIFVNSGVDGTIVSGLCAEQIRILSKHVPVVTVDNWFQEQLSDEVVPNNEGASYDATRYLINNGHSRIGTIGHTPEMKGSFPHEFYRGHIRALHEHGLDITSEFTYIPGNFDSADTYTEMKRILSGNTLPTALVSNDECAIAAIRACSECGLTIPHDMAIIGIDGIDMGEFIHPPLTTVSLNMESIGQTAVKQLFRRIDDPDSPFVRIQLNHRLIERQSV